MVILGIETSCDDTGIALIKASGKRRVKFDILSNIVSSQVKIHKKFGGVVPNLAAREHLKNLPICLKKALKKARNPKINLITVTSGPGLIPSLLIGVNFARTLAYGWKLPIVGVNHLEGHLFSVFLENRKKNFESRILNFEFPAVALLVSGGHTQLILITDYREYKVIGETQDDAAGECFDKIARLLNLGYPGGPAISAEAEKIRNPKSEIRNPDEVEDPRLLRNRDKFKRAKPPQAYQNSKFKIDLPRPMIKHKNYDFSFSGLKTAVLYLVKNNKNKLKNPKFIQALCKETQQAIIDVLIAKTLRAAKEYKVKTIILSGGVAANEELRNQMAKAIKKQIPNSLFLIPDSKFCTDNGTMIALAGYFKYLFGKPSTGWRKLKADANLKLKNW